MQARATRPPLATTAATAAAATSTNTNTTTTTTTTTITIHHTASGRAHADQHTPPQSRTTSPAATPALHRGRAAPLADSAISTARRRTAHAWPRLSPPHAAARLRLPCSRTRARAHTTHAVVAHTHTKVCSPQILHACTHARTLLAPSDASACATLHTHMHSCTHARTQPCRNPLSSL
jgi:hypothetical protein